MMVHTVVLAERQSQQVFSSRPSLRMTPSVTCRSVALAVVCLFAAANACADDRPPVIAANGDAFVAHRSGSDLWSIGSTSLELVIGFDASRTLALQRLVNPITGRDWSISPAPDFGITAGGERIALTSTAERQLRRRGRGGRPTTASR